MRRGFPRALLLALCAAMGAGPLAGCHTLHHKAEWFRPEFPRELDKVNLPYFIEAPDILLIDLIRAVPQPPYRVEPLDLLLIQVTDVLPDEPIGALYTVEPQGTVNLGPSYGAVRVVGLTLEEAKAAVEKHLNGLGFTKAKATLVLQQTRALQAVTGEHLVRPDGAIGLGTYGSVYVSGMTIDHAKLAIEAHLAQYLVDPKIALDVFAYNSKVYYVIFDGGGYGQQLFRVPYTGNETVLDAVSQLNGLPPVSSKKHIWLARPAPAEEGRTEILDVDWNAITQRGSPATNYQVLAGDRIYVRADCLIEIDNWLAKILTPIERIFGATLLGSETVQSVQGRNQGSGSGF